MRKGLLVLAALSLCLFALSTPQASAGPTPTYARCPVSATGAGTGPLCDCVIHCGNGLYWSDTGIPSSACADAFQACCNGWGNVTCN